MTVGRAWNAWRELSEKDREKILDVIDLILASRRIDAKARQSSAEQSAGHFFREKKILE